MGEKLRGQEANGDKEGTVLCTQSCRGEVGEKGKREGRKGFQNHWETVAEADGHRNRQGFAKISFHLSL